MARPALYRNIVLTSYGEPPPDHAEPEDRLWRVSPFCMGLNTLVTTETARLVNSLHFQGHWQQDTQGGKSGHGRLPDSAVLLNITIRAAVDRCVNLRSFK